MNKGKRWIGGALALLLVLALLPGAALAYDGSAPAQQVHGAVRASQLQSGAAVALTGDTVLTLDADVSVRHIEGAAKLTVRGSASLSVTDGVDVTAMAVESGTLKVSAARGTPRSGIRAGTLEISGGMIVSFVS